MKKNSQRIIFIAESAIIAAMYVVLTYISMLLGTDKGVIQFRLSEILTVLPFFTSAAIPGLTVGCLLANILTACALPDVVFGSIATLLGAIFTFLLRKYKWLAPLPPILSNAIIIPLVLRYIYEFQGTLLFFVFTVAFGEVVCCGIGGMLLLISLEKSRLFQRIRHR